MKEGKEVRSVFSTIIIFGILLPLSNLWLAIIFLSEILDFDFQKYSIPIIVILVVYSVCFLGYFGYQVIKDFPSLEKVPEEKRATSKLTFKIFPVFYPSTLGFFVAVLSSNLIYSVIGTSISLLLTAFLVFRNTDYIKVISRPTSRLKGITIIGWLYIISSVLYFIIFLKFSLKTNVNESFKLILGTTIIGYTFLQLTVGFGILYLFNAVRIMVIVFNSLHILGGVMGVITFLCSNEPFEMVRLLYAILTIIIPAVIIVYLTRPKVKENFIQEGPRLL